MFYLITVNGYKMERKDRNAKGGGLMVLYRSDLPVHRIKQRECYDIECVFLEMKLKIGLGEFYTFIPPPHPPSTIDSSLEGDMISKLDQSFIKYDRVCIIGDLNYSMLIPENSQVFVNIRDSFSLKNLIQNPTCFTKSSSPSLIDVILSNSSNPLCHTINFNRGLLPTSTEPLVTSSI